MLGLHTACADEPWRRGESKLPSPWLRRGFRQSSGSADPELARCRQRTPPGRALRPRKPAVQRAYDRSRIPGTSSAQARATHAAHKTDQRPRQPREVRLHDKIDEAVEGLGTNVCWPDPAFRSGCLNHKCPRSPFSAWLSSAAHWLASQVHIHSHTHPWWIMSTPAATRSSVSGTASCSVASGFDCIESMRNPAVGPRAGCCTARKVAGRNLIVDGPARGANDAAGTTTRSETSKRISMCNFNKTFSTVCGSPTTAAHIEWCLFPAFKFATESRSL